MSLPWPQHTTEEWARVLGMKTAKYSESQPRDDHGRFATVGAMPTPEQAKAVYLYAGYNSADINEALRSGPVYESHFVHDSVAQLDDLMAKSLIDDTTLYRGTTFGHMQNLKPGMVVRDDGFVSTSRSRTVAGRFTTPDGVSRIVTIDIPKNTHGIDVEHVTTVVPDPHIPGFHVPHGDVPEGAKEHEVILPRGSKFKVLSITATEARFALLPHGNTDHADRPRRSAMKGAADHVGRFVWDDGQTVVLSKSAAVLFKAGEASHTGFFVAVFLQPEAADKLAVPGGEHPEDLHITLAYCGHVKTFDEVALAKATAAIAEIAASGTPLRGRVVGRGRFPATPQSDGRDVIYATPEVDGLASLHSEIVDALIEAGVPPNTDHAWVPHITLAYVPEGAVDDAKVTRVGLTFTAITVIAGDSGTAYPLGVVEKDLKYSDTQPRDHDGRWGSGGSRADRAKATHKPATAEKQRWADRSEEYVRGVVGGKTTGDNAPTDVTVAIGHRLHGFEVKTMLENTTEQVTMHPESRARKQQWATDHHAVLHTVVIDDRQKFGAPGYSGHRLYYHRGVGSYHLNSMIQVKDEAHLRRLVKKES